MNRKKFLPVLLVGALALTVVLGVTAFQKVQASAPAVVSQVAAFFGRGPQGGTSDADLAAALGITSDKLTAAYTAATDEALKQAVAKGLITQTQADQYKANGNQHGDFGIFAQNGIDYNALLANSLGITVDKLQAAYVTAYNTAIDTAVTAGNLTQAQADLMKGRYALENSSKYQSAMQAAFTAAVNQAVTDGTITQAQADAILKANTGSGFELGGRGGFGGPGGFGGFGGRGGGHGGRGFDGGFGGNGNNSTNPTTPTTPSIQQTPTGGA